MKDAENDMKPMTIGRVARLAGVGVETVRFYERRGLVERPPRKQGGYRRYPEEIASRLLFIRRAKEIGFTLNEIKELLSLKLGPRSTCGEVRQRALSKIEDIERRIRMLEGMRHALVKLASACRGRGPVGECPILKALDGQEAYR